MTVDEVTNNRGTQAERCSVVIVHETNEALAHANSLCERIMAQMWNAVDIDVCHWPFTVLSKDSVAQEAASRAATAEIVVVAAAGEGTFSSTFLEWTERLVDLRQKHEGALVALFAPGTRKEEGARSRDVQLHRVALRAGMDYLNHLPDSPRRTIPDLMEWCASRAETFTGTLDEIIRDEPPPGGL